VHSYLRLAEYSLPSDRRLRIDSSVDPTLVPHGLLADQSQVRIRKAIEIERGKTELEHLVDLASMPRRCSAVIEAN
jgi:hypothetical protein